VGQDDNPAEMNQSKRRAESAAKSLNPFNPDSEWSRTELKCSI